MSLKTLYENPHSSDKLKVGSFDDTNLLEKCVSHVKPRLLTNPEIIVFGKKCYQRRNVAFFSDYSEGYKYSGKMMKSQPLSSDLKEMLNFVNKMLNTDFNGILVNEYKDGSDYISAHSDDEIALTTIGIASLSYGATRKFRIRDKSTKKIVYDYDIQSRDIVLMTGSTFQKRYTHEIPIQKLVKDSRISFTFRKHN